MSLEDESRYIGQERHQRCARTRSRMSQQGQPREVLTGFRGIRDGLEVVEAEEARERDLDGLAASRELPFLGLSVFPEALDHLDRGPFGKVVVDFEQG